LQREALLQNGGDDKCKLTAEAGATDKEKNAFLLQQYQKFEQYVYWFLGEMVFKDHRNCLDNHKDYVLNDVVKPKSMSIITYLSRVSYMYEVIPYLQAPTDEGETARFAGYKALLTEADAKTIRRAQYNGLPKYFVNEIEDRRIKWRALSKSDWHDELVSIERKEQRDLADDKAKKRKSAEGMKTPGSQVGSASKLARTSGKKGGTPGGNINQPKGSAVGEMKFCPLCHGAGLPEAVYRSHNLATCENKSKFNQALAAAVKPRPTSGGGRGRGRGEHHRMEQLQNDRLRRSFEEASTREQIRRAFHAASSAEEVCQYLRVLDPTLEDTYLARRTPMYYDAQGKPEIQSSLPMAYDESNIDYGQYDDSDGNKKPAADGHY
jgi:hypothetical protein